MDTRGYSGVGEGKSGRVMAEQYGEYVTVSEDSGGFSGAVYQSGENGQQSCIF